MEGARSCSSGTPPTGAGNSMLEDIAGKKVAQTCYHTPLHRHAGGVGATVLGGGPSAALSIVVAAVE